MEQKAESGSAKSARAVVMPDTLWQKLLRAAATRQLRTSEACTPSDLMRAAAVVVASEELDEEDAPSRRIAQAVCEQLGVSPDQHAEDVARLVRDQLWSVGGN